MRFIEMSRLASVTGANRTAGLAGRSGYSRIHSSLSSVRLFFTVEKSARWNPKFHRSGWTDDGDDQNPFLMRTLFFITFFKLWCR